MSGYDFEIELTAAEDALHLRRGSLSCGRAFPFVIAPDGTRRAWAADIVRNLRPKHPRLALTLMQTHIMANRF